MEISYKELKARQKKDLKSGKIVNMFSRNFSTWITYVLAKMGCSPNTVTISNYFVGIVGFIFLSFGTYLFLIVGLIFFVVFILMDHVDGEIARALNKESFEGLYLEALEDYIYFCCLGAGLAIGLFKLYESEVYLYAGFILTALFIIENATTNSVKFVLRKGIIDKKIGKNLSDKDLQKMIFSRIEGSDSWQSRNLFLRIFGINPPGLFYCFEFISPILIVLALIEYYLISYGNYMWIVYGQVVGILSLYIFAVGIVKLIKIVRFIAKLKNDRHITAFLNELK